MKKPTKTSMLGVFADGISPEGVVRFSTIIRSLRRQGAEDTARKLEEEQKAVGSYCALHGELTDPVIGLLEDRVAYACPWCSGEAVREAWEKEGMKS